MYAALIRLCEVVEIRELMVPKWIRGLIDRNLRRLIEMQMQCAVATLTAQHAGLTCRSS